MQFDGCAGCYFGNLCTRYRGVCDHYAPLKDKYEEERTELIIERGRILFREEMLEYLDENAYFDN